MTKPAKMTIRAPRDLYKEFQSIAYQQGAEHNKIFLRMMEMYVEANGHLIAFKQSQKIKIRITPHARPA